MERVGVTSIWFTRTKEMCVRILPRNEEVPVPRAWEAISDAAIAIDAAEIVAPLRNSRRVHLLSINFPVPRHSLAPFLCHFLPAESIKAASLLKAQAIPLLN